MTLATLTGLGACSSSSGEGDAGDNLGPAARGSTTAPTTTVSITDVGVTTAPVSTGRPITSAVGFDGPRALDVMTLIPVEDENGVGFDREAWGSFRTQEGGACRVDQQVLLLEREEADEQGECRHVSGTWFSYIDGGEIDDPSEATVVQLVSAREAYESGGGDWSSEYRATYMNDTSDSQTLVVVSTATAEERGDQDPGEWQPPDGGGLCTYLAEWIGVKARWGLSMDTAEHATIRAALEEHCADQQIAPLVPLPDTGLATTPLDTRPGPSLPDDVLCDSSYPGICIPPAPPILACNQIPFRDFEVVAPDPHGFDGNGNGVGCES